MSAAATTAQADMGVIFISSPPREYLNRVERRWAKKMWKLARCVSAAASCARLPWPVCGGAPLLHAERLRLSARRRRLLARLRRDYLGGRISISLCRTG